MLVQEKCVGMRVERMVFPHQCCSDTSLFPNSVALMENGEIRYDFKENRIIMCSSNAAICYKKK